jgi:membrane-associated two-gene conflict system component 1 (EACC1)
VARCARLVRCVGRFDGRSTESDDALGDIGTVPQLTMELDRCGNIFGSDMNLFLTVSGDDDQARGVDELQDWLDHEADLQGQVSRVPAKPRPGELGAGWDTLSVALGAGGTLSVLAASLKVFFAQPRRSDLKVTVRAADGRSVVFDAKRVKDIDVVTVLRETLGGAGQ